MAALASLPFSITQKLAKFLNDIKHNSAVEDMDVLVAKFLETAFFWKEKEKDQKEKTDSS